MTDKTAAPERYTFTISPELARWMVIYMWEILPRDTNLTDEQIMELLARSINEPERPDDLPAVAEALRRAKQVVARAAADVE